MCVFARVQSRDLDHWLPKCRHRAARGLGRLGGRTWGISAARAAYPYATELAAVLEDEDAAVRLAAVIALGEVAAAEGERARETV